MRGQFEYRAIPAPRKAKSARGLRGTDAKFANAFSLVMNEMGADGWEYLRADTLPCEERQGLTGKTVKYHSMLVFRRPLEDVARETSEATEVLASLSVPAVLAMTPGSDTPSVAAPAPISEPTQEPPLSSPVTASDEDVTPVSGSDDSETSEKSTVAAE